MLAASANIRFMLLVLQGHPEVSVVAQVALAMYGIWNLDFFVTLIPHICLEVNTLKALVLDYGIVFFPLIMLVVTYFLLELHAYNFRPIVGWGDQFIDALLNFKGHLNVKTSIIEAFATFLLLS